MDEGPGRVLSWYPLEFSPLVRPPAEEPSAGVDTARESPAAETPWGGPVAVAPASKGPDGGQGPSAAVHASALAASAECLEPMPLQHVVAQLGISDTNHSEELEAALGTNALLF